MVPKPNSWKKKKKPSSPTRHHTVEQAFGSLKGTADWFRFQQGSSFPHSSGARIVLRKKQPSGNWMDGCISLPQEGFKETKPFWVASAHVVGDSKYHRPSWLQWNSTKPKLKKQSNKQKPNHVQWSQPCFPKQLFQRGSEAGSSLWTPHCFMALSLLGFLPYCYYMATKLKKATREECRAPLLLGGPLLMGEIKRLSESKDGYNTAISSSEHAIHPYCITFLQNS